MRDGRQKSKVAPWPYQVLGEHSAVGLVYDLPDSMQSIQQRVLDRWEVSFYEALEVARQNLTELKHGFIGPESGEGIYLSASGDNYDASRLLLTELIRQFGVKPEPYDHIMFRPAFTGEIDQQFDMAVIDLVKVAKDYWTFPVPYPGDPYDGNQFQKYYSDHNPIVFRMVVPDQDDD